MTDIDFALVDTHLLYWLRMEPTGRLVNIYPPKVILDVILKIEQGVGEIS